MRSRLRIYQIDIHLLTMCTPLYSMMRARDTHPDLEVQVPGLVDAQLLLGLLQKI